MVMFNEPDSRGCVVQFDRAKTERLKKTCQKCTGESFEFEGNLYLKKYAEYLLQFLETRFGMKG